MSEYDNNIKVCCPQCLGAFDQNTDETSPKVCQKCRRTYTCERKYYDFYVSEEMISRIAYPPTIEQLFFDLDKILSLTYPKNSIMFNFFFKRRIFNNEWIKNLEKLKNSIKQSGTSEKQRVEFMTDDISTEEYKNQKEFTELKSKIIMNLVSPVKHSGNSVLHIGCGGHCNNAIPIEYQKNGFVNYGIDVVRSYVEEFLDYGNAHLSNALFLPYADETFDIINFSDILEHLFDPLRALQEANRVLKKDGYLVLDTPNRAYVDMKNPFSLIEYFVGKIFPNILRPRIISGEWDGDVFFHSEFNKKEINSLFFHTGFKVIEISAKLLERRLPSRKYDLKNVIKFFVSKIAPTSPWFALVRKERHIARNK
jgi:SAM-dependent methyltransferase